RIAYFRCEWVGSPRGRSRPMSRLSLSDQLWSGFRLQLLEHFVRNAACHMSSGFRPKRTQLHGPTVFESSCRQSPLDQPMVVGFGLAEHDRSGGGIHLLNGLDAFLHSRKALRAHPMSKGCVGMFHDVGFYI